MVADQYFFCFCSIFIKQKISRFHLLMSVCGKESSAIVKPKNTYTLWAIVPLVTLQIEDLLCWMTQGPKGFYYLSKWQSEFCTLKHGRFDSKSSGLFWKKFFQANSPGHLDFFCLCFRDKHPTLLVQPVNNTSPIPSDPVCWRISASSIL